MSKDGKQKIKCDVYSCKHNNKEDNICDLEEIKVSCTCDNDDCDCNNDTICYSFEEDSECHDCTCDKSEDDEEVDEDELEDDEDMDEEIDEKE